MKRAGACKILAKYGANAYKVELPNELSISPIFNVAKANLIKFKEPLTKFYMNNKGIGNDEEPNVLPPKMQLEAERLLDSRVKKVTRHKVYMKHLIRWKHKPKSEATWVAATNFKKLGIVEDILSTVVTRITFVGSMVQDHLGKATL